jgi:hypothetical protein
MSMDYKYTGAYPAVFPYEYGADAEVTRAEGNPPVGAVGTTTHLYLGDVLHLNGETEHAWLEPLGDTSKALTVDELRAALTDAGIEFDPTLRKGELRDLLAAHEAGELAPIETDETTEPVEAEPEAPETVAETSEKVEDE